MITEEAAPTFDQRRRTTDSAKNSAIMIDGEWPETAVIQALKSQPRRPRIRPRPRHRKGRAGENRRQTGNVI